jgi:hypothetical protein
VSNARAVMTSHIAIGQLIASVRRHALITPKTAIAFGVTSRRSSARHEAMLSNAPNRKTTDAGDRPMKPPPRAKQ